MNSSISKSICPSYKVLFTFFFLTLIISTWSFFHVIFHFTFSALPITILITRFSCSFLCLFLKFDFLVFTFLTCLSRSFSFFHAPFFLRFWPISCIFSIFHQFPSIFPCDTWVLIPVSEFMISISYFVTITLSFSKFLQESSE